MAGADMLIAVDLDLVAGAEIAEMLGVTRQRVFQLARKHDDFPRPAADISVGRIWRRSDIQRWAIKHGRLTPDNP
jgi:prophage regulatory protein